MPPLDTPQTAHDRRSTSAGLCAEQSPDTQKGLQLKTQAGLSLPVVALKTPR